MTEINDLILDLNFVPAWARRSPSLYRPPETDTVESEDKPRRKHDRTHRDNRRDRSHRQDRPVHDNRRPLRGSVSRQRAGDASKTTHERHKSPEPLPLTISFLPERHGLKPLITLLSGTGRAYPLLELAAMFLSKSEYYAVKLEVMEPIDGT